MNKIIEGDALQKLREMPDESVQSCITSPPYWELRDYGVEGQLGLEKTPDEFVANMTCIFREVKRVLRDDGTLWLNIGDSYANTGTGGNGATGGLDKSTLRGKNPPKGTTPVKKYLPKGLKAKDLVGIPWMLAFALRTDGWYLRQDIIWHKPNPMPESVQDRCTKAHEYIFLMSKSPTYYYDIDAIKERSLWSGDQPEIGGWGKGSEPRTSKDLQTSAHRKIAAKAVGIEDRKHARYEMANKRSVWSVGTHPFREAHFATFPEKLIEPMVMASTPPNGIILDPFMGAGTTGLVAKKLGRKYLGIELNPAYIEIAERRLANVPNALF